MKNTTRKIVLSSLLAALVCVTTMIVKIPSPLKGYINLGDCVVLLSGWILPLPYAFLAAGIGSALADFFSGYMVYVPATFIIKGLMSVTAWLFLNILLKKSGKLTKRIIGGIVAEIFMIAGYFLFESILYGAVASLVNIPANAVQGVAGLILGIAVAKVFEKGKLTL